MGITTQLNEKANVKLPTAADSLIAGRRIITLEELQVSTASQSTIVLANFAVDVANIKNLLVIIDGKILTEGAGNDFTLTSISPNNTSNTISLTQTLSAGLNIKVLYLGVVVTNSASLDTLSPAMSDWVPFTLEVDATVTNPTKGTTTRDQAYWRRVGDSMEIRWDYEQPAGTGSSGSGIYLFKLPNGYSIDGNKTPIIGNTGLGDAIVGFAAWNNAANTDFLARMFAFDSTHLAIQYQSTASSYVVVTDAIGLGQPWGMSFFARVPIAGWSSNVIAQNSKIFQASAYAANGVNVTSTPDDLGEYRTYTKNSSALTGTDNAPTGSYIPSLANGFKIDGSTPFASAGTSGQPNRIEVFIGLNKYPTYSVYSGTGRTGAVSKNNEPNNGTTFYGLNFDYDPSTGVVTVDAIDQPSGTTIRNAARSIPTGGAAPADLDSVYFDINVSDNVLPVQFSDPSKVAHNEIFVYGGSGHGSTDTFVRWFTTLVSSVGTAISYFNNSSNGSYWVINEPGLYSIYYEDASSAGASAGITKNSPFLNTAVSDPTQDPYRLISTTVSGAASSQPAIASVTSFFQVGDVIRAMNDSSSTPNGTTNNGTNFRIIKIANG